MHLNWPGMPKREWTTPEQKQFLQDELPWYNSMSTKEYNHHYIPRLV